MIAEIATADVFAERLRAGRARLRVMVGGKVGYPQDGYRRGREI